MLLNNLKTKLIGQHNGRKTPIHEILYILRLFWLFLIGFEPIVVCLETCNALQFWPSQLNYMTLMNHIAAIAISNPAISSGFLLTRQNGANLYLNLHLESLIRSPLRL